MSTSTSADLLFIIAGLIGLFLVFRNPILGIALLVAFETMADIFPRIGFLPTISLPLGGITLAAYLVQSTVQKQTTRQKIPGLFFFFIIWFVFSNVIGQYGFTEPSTRNWFFTYLQLALMIWLLSQLVKSEKDIELVMKVLLCFFLVSSLIGLFQYGFQNNTSGEIIRISGLTGNSNRFTSYALTGIMLCIYFWENENRIIRIVLFGAMSVMLVAVLISGSRGGVLFTLVALLYYFLRQAKARKQSLLILISVIVVLVVSWQFIPSTLKIRISEIPNAIMLGEDTVGLRYSAWKAALELWKQSPLLGIGSGRFQYYNQTYNLVPENNLIVPHNMFVTVLVENGLFGSIPFLGMLLLTTVLIFKAERNSLGNEKFIQLSIVWQTIFLFQLLAGMKGSIQYSKLLWLVIGISIPLQEISRRMFFKKTNSMAQSSLPNQNLKTLNNRKI